MEPSTAPTGYLVFDTESVPDGRLLREVKYRGESLSDAEAVERAQSEQRETSWNGSDFLPASFHIPVAVCIARVGRDFALQSFQCLDAPQYRPRQIAADFWKGVNHYCKPENRLKLVSFNGRGFDMPLLEMAAFRYGLSAPDYYDTSRKRFDSSTIDLLDWFNNFGAIRHAGGIDLMAKLIGKPGKLETTGRHVYGLWKEGRLAEINDYCACDTLDTYFVFLRMCVMRGEITLEAETQRVESARRLIENQAAESPALREYLANWSDHTPWP